MQLDNDIALLQKLPLFAGMDREDLSTIAFSSERLAFQRGENLVNDGHLGHAAYVILSGSAELLEGDKGNRRIHMVSPGAIVGELAMLVEFTYTTTAKALEEVEVLELRRDLIHMMMQQYPSIAEHFSSRIHGRLSGLVEELRRFDRPKGPAPQGSDARGAL